MKYEKIYCVGCDADLSARWDWEPIMQLQDDAEPFYGVPAKFVDIVAHLHMCYACIGAMEARHEEASLPIAQYSRE
jgi:hypothetical protein